MARRLRRTGPAPWALALLALPVLLCHVWLGDAVRRLQLGWGAEAAMPTRMTVSFLRQMKVAQPVPRATAPRALRHLGSAPAPGRWVATAIAAEPAASAVFDAVPSVQDVPAAPAAVAASEAQPGPEWPLSTRLSYALTGNFHGPVNGDSQVEWVRKGSHYQVHLDVSVGPRLAPFISRQMTSDGMLTPRGIAPQRFDEDTRVLFASRQRKTMLFQDERVVLADGHGEPLPPGVQDAASQFVQLTWLFLTGRETMSVGHVVELPLALPRRQYMWGYVVIGEELLQTPIGPLATWHLKPTRAPGGGDLSAEVWLAPGLQYLPVRLVIREDAETFVDLMLKTAPLQEAPIVAPSTNTENPP